MTLKRFFIILFSILHWYTSAMQAQIVENFETGLPTTAPASETPVQLSSGTWLLYKGAQTTTHYSGTYGLSLSNTGYITTPLLEKVISISYYIRPSGASGTAVLKSVNGGPFVRIGGASIASGNFMQITFPVNDTNSNIRLKIIDTTSQTHYVDQVSIATEGSIPGISISTASLPDFGMYVMNSFSPSKNFTVSAINLTQNLAISAPAGFLLSTDNTTFSGSVNVSPTAGTIPSTLIYVRFAPTTAAGQMNGDISLTSLGASAKVVAVKGKAIGIEPTIQSNLNLGTITGNSIQINFSGGNGTNHLLIARSNSAVDWLPSDGFSVIGVNTNYSAADDQGGGNRVVYAGNAGSITVTGLAVGTLYHFAAVEYNGSAANSENYLTANPARLNATTLAVAGLFVNPNSLSFGKVVKLFYSGEKTYTLSGAYLTPSSGAITVNAPAGFEVSYSSGSGFSNAINVNYSNSTLPETNIFVRFHPDNIGGYNTSITNTGGGASNIPVNVQGVGIDSSILFVKTYFVSPFGNDNNPGTIDAPFYNISKAVALAQGMDTIYVRGGTYQYNTRINLTQSGSEAKMICLFAYNNEVPILDFSTQPYGSDYRAFLLTGSYWYIKGLTIMKAGDNGIKVEGSHNIIERCVLHHNGDTGIQLGFGHTTPNPGGTLCSYNLILNCDSYFNFDPDSNGGDADGFACKMHNGIGNVFRGCRSWHNSDDGWDLFETDWPVVIDSCWTWHNGDKADFGGVAGNGNGFKLGGNGSGGDSKGTHIVTNSICFKTTVRGFDQNSHKGGVIIYNCLSYANSYNFMFEKSSSSGVQNVVKNCVEFGHTGAMAFEFAGDFVLQNNTWNLNLNASAADFGLLSEEAAMAPRRPDGGLPDNTYARLVAGSQLIDKGVNVGRPYAGLAPDLGAFEFGLVSDVKDNFESHISSFDLKQNYPNPFNPSTKIDFELKTPAMVRLIVYDMLGNEVQTLVNSVMTKGLHSVNFSASHLSSGVYYAVLLSENQRSIIKMILMK